MSELQLLLVPPVAAGGSDRSPAEWYMGAQVVQHGRDQLFLLHLVARLERVPHMSPRSPEARERNCSLCQPSLPPPRAPGQGNLTKKQDHKFIAMPSPFIELLPFRLTLFGSLPVTRSLSS